MHYSLLLGLLAWLLPVAALTLKAEGLRKYQGVFSLLSFSACTAAMFIQVVWQADFADRHDWTAIMDTAQPLVRASAVLIIVTIILNIAVLIKSKLQQTGESTKADCR